MATAGFIALRTSTPPKQMTNLFTGNSIINPQLPLSQVQSMEHAVAGSEAPRRFNTALISSFAGAAILLAALGIYSVIVSRLRFALRRWRCEWPWVRSAREF